MASKDNEQLTMLYEEVENDKPVTVLGKTFKNDKERRQYFTEELRKKLGELKNIEGYPIGNDEDILALSNPPFYTACPNPWLDDLVNEWEKAKINNKDTENYNREPFASDVSEGKNDAVYNAHSYHTKVPYKAIMRYILHYTEPGDIVLDGFSGTGMTGVAAKRCANAKEVEELGYRVKEGDVLQDNIRISKLGQRKIILNDLSPSATLISYNYNHDINTNEFLRISNDILKKVKEECSWMYETTNQNGEKGYINNVVWSDIFICPNCSEEINYWNVAVDVENKKINSNDIECENCLSKLKKKDLERSWESIYDLKLGKTVKQIKQKPVYLYYSIGSTRYEKKVEKSDVELLNKINDMESNYWYPTERMTEGDESRRNDRIGYTHVHHFYTRRNLITLAKFYDLAKQSKYFTNLLFFFQASINRATKTNRFRFGGTGGLSGTLYVPSLIFERNVISLLEKKLSDFQKILLEENVDSNQCSVTTQSTSTNLSLKNNSVDYIFTDPPFGKNLMYSELNYLWEVWLKIRTNNSSEAIINSTQRKGIIEYQKLMEESFKTYYRVLKPSRWITIEFSNSQASVWNSIQEALQRAGFIIANVSALDKKQGSFKAVTTTTAVKQDLVISAYKPSDTLVTEIKSTQGSNDTTWLFVKQHLDQLPIFLGKKGEAQLIVERTPRVLFDRMVAYHVQNGIPVPISSANFQQEITQKYPTRDGMVFLENQVAEYDKKRTLVKEFAQMNLFVSDENSAIEWLRQLLIKKPQSRQDIHPAYMKEIQHIDKHELLPELDSLLEQNFLVFEGQGVVPNQIATYLKQNYKDLRNINIEDPSFINKALNRWYVPDPNKQADLEKLREKSLFREFQSYVEEISKSKKKLKQFRTEAIRAGFKKAWSNKEYHTIVDVGSRLPEKVIQEDDKLLMYFDNAQIRLGL
ncbi:DNA modification methylase [Salirhabdus euzebyi]|uniref:DNA modification methylase n=1 Tax=Salirhabdus euzebyi TaxID=394506 RepID=A0A841Q2V4_9BACI|nr:DNA methyltransferase [Salirhabdus euzebyi]MBB6451618.1 DNA modification methylase [Salirhabdus euzebyi]